MVSLARQREAFSTVSTEWRGRSSSVSNAALERQRASGSGADAAESNAPIGAETYVRKCGRILSYETAYDAQLVAVIASLHADRDAP